MTCDQSHNAVNFHGTAEQQKTDASNWTGKAQSQIQNSPNINDETPQLEPQNLSNKTQPFQKWIRFIFDVSVFAVALLFLLFGLLVHQHDGAVLEPHSVGSKLLSAATYVSCYP